jgi:tetratricopeptide (TPR) repeat protein
MDFYKEKTPLVILGLFLLGLLVLKANKTLDTFNFNLGILMLNQAIAHNLEEGSSFLEKAENYFSRIEFIKEEPNERKMLVGYIPFLRGDMGSALTIWQGDKAVAIRLLEWGNLELSSDNNNETAKQWFLWAAKSDPQLRDAWFNLALLAYEEDNIVDALGLLDRASGASNWAQIGSSDVLFRQGQMHQDGFQNYAQAISYYELALQADDFLISGSQSELYHRQGYITELAENDLEKSIDYYRKAIEVNPNHAWAHLRLAKALYYSTNDLQTTLEHIEIAIGIWPEDESRKWPHRILGDIYSDAEQPQKAIEQYHVFLSLDPSDEGVKEKLHLLVEK